jgi:glutathione synthase/RimK-type ligase-like ATP-grasp enzyme
MILIVSDRHDTQIYTVTHYLDRWNAPYFQLNVSDFPLQTELCFSLGSGGLDSATLILQDGRVVNCLSISAVWYRKPLMPRISSGLPPDQSELAFDECRHALLSWYTLLENRYWISDLQNIRRANDKLLQLREAVSIGFAVPTTIVTNNAQEAWEFYKQEQGNVIFKPISYSFLSSRRNVWEEPTSIKNIFTTLLTNYSEEDFVVVNQCPCLFQSYVDKRYELRVTVVRDQVFAAKIHSQEREKAKHDWRRDLYSVEYSACKLPDNIAEQCVELVKRLGLQYGALDLIVTPDDEYVFLEINPSGQYGWIETRVGLRISEALATALFDACKV